MEIFLISVALFFFMILLIAGFERAFSRWYLPFTILSLFVPPIFFIWVVILGVIVIIQFIGQQQQKESNINAN